MIDFSNSILVSLIAHGIGNKLRDEGVDFSNDLVKFEGSDTQGLFLRYVLSAFDQDEFFSFNHETDLSLNEIYSYVSKIFKDKNEFEGQSKNIALHLYNQSIHPKVNYGELYVAYFSNCIIDGEGLDVIGIFKSETKEPFLKPNKRGDGYILSGERGVNISKLDKGCLIFNKEKESGYRISNVSNLKLEEAQYWKDRFLGISPRIDGFQFTKNYLSMARNFVTKQLKEEYDISTADKADYLNRSVEYFKTHETFNEAQFTNNVFENDAVINSFAKYKEEYQEKHDIELGREFEIAPTVVKKQAKVFQSILKLDKNFHIYIHGKAELIEKGYDSDKGKKFYKIYFDEES